MLERSAVARLGVMILNLVTRGNGHPVPLIVPPGAVLGQVSCASATPSLSASAGGVRLTVTFAIPDGALGVPLLSYDFALIWRVPICAPFHLYSYGAAVSEFRSVVPS